MIPAIPRRASLALLTLAAFVPLHAAVIQNYTLGSPQKTATWNDLTDGNPTFTPSSGSGTGTASVQAPGSQWEFGLYSPGGPYSCTVSQGTAFDIQNVVFQIDLVEGPGSLLMTTNGPLLSFNGGSQNLAANLFLNNGQEARTTVFGPQTYTGASWQWDLSALGDTITSVSIFIPLVKHSSVAGFQVDSAGTYTGAIPEPSAVTLCGLAGLLVLRRRRA